jgi:hypothetical protein
MGRRAHIATDISVSSVYAAGGATRSREREERQEEEEGRGGSVGKSQVGIRSSERPVTCWVQRQRVLGESRANRGVAADEIK